MASGIAVAIPIDGRWHPGRNQTMVPVRGECLALAGEQDPVELVLAAAVRLAIGDLLALVNVSASYVAVDQPGQWGGVWHAETPEEWADAIDDIQARVGFDGAVALGLLDRVLDWRPGWPPETEGW